MVSQRLKSVNKNKGKGLPSLRTFLAARAYSAIILAALFCTLTVKFFHAWRYGLFDEYLGWVMADLAVLMTIEIILSLICFRWPKKAVVRAATIFAAVVCTWSVMNAGWLIRTGTQILPRVLLPLFRAPVNTFCIIGVNLAKMPAAAILLLGPSAVALAFFFYVLARPKMPSYNGRKFMVRVIVCLIIVMTVVVARPAIARRGSSQIGSVGLRYNSQLRAVMSLVLPDYRRPLNPKRKIPNYDSLNIAIKQQGVKQNVVVVVLEGVQYHYTSLACRRSGLTPYLTELAEQGIEFTNTRSTLTHTTKALFSILTGRFPSASQDIAEAVPTSVPYASMATILKGKLGYRTAFFQSALGSFESRPGLVYNLGFDKFWARDDSNDPNSFIGYLGCDEFTMLKPVGEWVKAGQEPFFLTILCSVTHDPYEVPEWYGEAAKEPLGRYEQSISYTDKFLAALDVELVNLGVADNTILCVIGDHGEAFGEHGLLGHERIVFDEALRVPFCLRAPFLIETGVKFAEPASSVDLTPTILGLLGFNTADIGFDGADLFDTVSKDRKVYFTTWMQEGPAGFISGNRKYIYNPAIKTTCVYDMVADPEEQNRIELTEQENKKISSEIVTWRINTIFRIDQRRTGKKVLFDKWTCNWTDRVSSTKRIRIRN
jgi:glucan phosphoethanolaminetransferase (alkaline phosphatase superfamily)